MPAFHLSSQILSYGDILHLGRDDALSRVMHLSHAGSGLRAKWSTFQSRKLLKRSAVFYACNIFRTLGEISIVLRKDLATGIFLDVAASHDPSTPQRGQALADIVFVSRIRPRAACVIDTHGRVFLDRSVKVFRRAERDLAKWY